MNRSSHDDKDLEVHATGRYLRLVERDNWEFVSRANARGVVVLVAMTEDDRLVLVEQYRTPVGTRVIELPAGLVGDLSDREESLGTAAQRELLEETGYQAESWSILLECPSSPGMSDEIVTFLQAHRIEKTGAGGGDHSEDIEVHLVARDGIDQWLYDRLREGLLIDPKIYSALYWLKFPGSAPGKQEATSA